MHFFTLSSGFAALILSIQLGTVYVQGTSSASTTGAAAVISTTSSPPDKNC
eukprot:CAMPEP_0119016430 /NCGR_PEP_ID=MMETSP1176-20130426/12947_1 /TAXON_ID=265551 /ORGANISM="Synedropsis recta cf, Strain CCMP1620" /LENGTH=50 /DNA_ID=CAMNT_0006969841 /DNA_START=180 /DNA_END=329 /DNA_ORIENTATION=+